VLSCHGHKRYNGMTASPLHRATVPRASHPMAPNPMATNNTPYIRQLWMDNSKRDIDSDVYVDFKTFYQSASPCIEDFRKLLRADSS
jgi:hypothetical protein